ncbi:MAG: hypothetical protein LBS16_04895 [Prevotellaceae bacterium]|nr:hypothetical protein [Prevotellaceae bacterium]
MCVYFSSSPFICLIKINTSVPSAFGEGKLTSNSIPCTKPTERMWSIVSSERLQLSTTL